MCSTEILQPVAALIGVGASLFQDGPEMPEIPEPPKFPAQEAPEAPKAKSRPSDFGGTVATSQQGVAGAAPTVRKTALGQ